LWMGVPVLTKPGIVPSSRGCYSLLTTAGLTKFIADTDEAYIASCVEWASKPGVLSHQRATLRQRVERSALANYSSFARDMESAYRQMWLRWCGHVTP
jgi:protein O-GlcNAc transferase